MKRKLPIVLGVIATIGAATAFWLVVRGGTSTAAPVPYLDAVASYLPADAIGAWTMPNFTWLSEHEEARAVVEQLRHSGGELERLFEMLLEPQQLAELGISADAPVGLAFVVEAEDRNHYEEYWMLTTGLSAPWDETNPETFVQRLEESMGVYDSPGSETELLDVAGTQWLCSDERMCYGATGDRLWVISTRYGTLDDATIQRFTGTDGSPRAAARPGYASATHTPAAGVASAWFNIEAYDRVTYSDHGPRNDPPRALRQGLTDLGVTLVPDGDTLRVRATFVLTEDALLSGLRGEPRDNQVLARLPQPVRAMFHVRVNPDGALAVANSVLIPWRAHWAYQEPEEVTEALNTTLRLVGIDGLAGVTELWSGEFIGALHVDTPAELSGDAPGMTFGVGLTDARRGQDVLNAAAGLLANAGLDVTTSGPEDQQTHTLSVPVFSGTRNFSAGIAHDTLWVASGVGTLAGIVTGTSTQSDLTTAAAQGVHGAGALASAFVYRATVGRHRPEPSTPASPQASWIVATSALEDGRIAVDVGVPMTLVRQLAEGMVRNVDRRSAPYQGEMVRAVEGEAEELLEILGMTLAMYYDTDHFDENGRMMRPHLPASSIGYTPPLEVALEACQTGTGMITPDPTYWLAEPWQSLGFAITNPHRFVLGLETAGEGEGSTFTAIAQGDPNCDGTITVYELSGRVQNGSVVLDGRPTRVAGGP